MTKFNSLLNGLPHLVKNLTINLLYNFDTTLIEDWILAGDFNLVCSPDNRNKPGADINDMLLFIDLLKHLDLIERLLFQGCPWSS